jgi:tetratricopeptide (TPR) repeat protein
MAWMQLAEAYQLANNDAGAIQSLNRALEIRPAPPQARIMLARIASKQGNVSEANRLAEEITREYPRLPIGASLSAELALQAKDYAAAANHYKRALTLEPKDGALAGRYHNSLGLSGQNAPAQAFAAQFQKDNPFNVTFLTYLADVELRAGRCDQAIPYYRKVAERDANNVMVLNNLAWCASETKQPDALGIAERALRLAPRAPAVMDTAGVILSTQGQHERALKLLTEATVAAPRSAELKLHLAQAYGRAGQKDRARTEADAALAAAEDEATKTKVRKYISSI